MADETALNEAKEVFDTLCQALDEDDWHYRKSTDGFRIQFGARGEDLPIDLTVDVDVMRRLVFVMSPLPVTVPEDKRMDMAIAVSVANNGLVDGCFDYDIKNGRLFFRLSNSYIESKLSKEAFLYMVMCACHVIDDYNDRFLLLAKGVMSIQQFIEAENH